MDFRGMLVDGGSRLGAEVAVAGIEVERGDVVGAVGAGKLHAALDASDGIEALHNLEFSPLGWNGKARGWGSEGNEVATESVPKWEWDGLFPLSDSEEFSLSLLSAPSPRMPSRRWIGQGWIDQGQPSLGKSVVLLQHFPQAVVREGDDFMIVDSFHGLGGDHGVYYRLLGGLDRG
jgi:hypothetical protein